MSSFSIEMEEIKMSNTIDNYVDLRGDLSPIDFPYNEIDYLIFSELAYVHLDHIFKSQTHQTYTLQQLYQCYHQKNQEFNDEIIYNQSHFLFEKISKMPRYQNIQLIHYVNEVDKDLIKQFSAMTFLLEDQTMVISYRGTDDDLIGWHEDFLMLCEKNIPSQISSVQYLEQACLYQQHVSLLQSLKNRHLGSSLWTRLKKHFLYKKNYPIILTGHSKGGHLAMYAGCFSCESVKKRIQHIYNYDGPGFQERLMLTDEYKQMLPSIHSYIPHYSFFGIVLGHEEDYTVVKSQYTGMYQHDAFSWFVNTKGFIEDDLSMESVDFAIQVILFLDKLTQQEKRLFVQSMFELFDHLNLYTFSDLSHISYKTILNAIKELTFFDKKLRKMFVEVLHMLWLEARKAKR